MKNYIYIFLAISVFYQSTEIHALPCVPQKDNYYEKIYCQLYQKGKAHTLPNIFEFRKNPPLTQAFLLKKPAERAGIPLKIPSRKNRETVDRQSDLLLAALTKKEPKSLAALSDPISAQTQDSQIQNKPTQVQAIKSTPKNLLDTSLLASECLASNLTITCADGDYHFIGNKTNQHLDSHVLTQNHKLDLPVYNDGDLQGYLKNAYIRYIDGMNEIGLAASTMTYSKFTYLYQTISEQNVDFVGRFETMYTFLKKDKSSIAVDTTKKIADDFTMDNCYSFENRILTCAHKRVNYIFAKSETSGP